MNEIEKLYKNINIFIMCDCLEEEMQVFAEENPNLNSLEELNEIMEDEILCMAENAE